MFRNAGSKVMWVGRGKLFALLLAVMVALILGYATKAYAAPGYLDPSFDTDGKAITDFANTGDVGTALTLQEDGKVVVVGYTYTGGTTGNDIAVARYNADGSLDTTFGTGGRVTTSIGSGSSSDNASAVAVRADGKIVVAGQAYNGSNYDIAVARYNADGSLDTTFSGDGKLITAVGPGFDSAYSIALQGNKVVVAGQAYTGEPASGGTREDFALLRYDNNGNLDTTFGTGGVVKTDFSSGSYDGGQSVAVQEDGKIVVGGVTYNHANTAPSYDFALARYSATGTLDTTFDGDGKAITHFGYGSDVARSVAVQEDGKIVAAGRASNGSNNDFALARYRTNGTLDGEFSANGKAMIDFGSYDTAYGLALQDDGRMVVGGESASDFALARLNDDGSLNNSFHNDGKLKTDFFGSIDGTQGVAVHEDGRIVAAGYTYNGSNYDFALARYYGGNDDTPPRVKLPGQALITNSTVNTTGNVPVRLSWSATDLHGEVTRYQLQRSTDGGSYQNINLLSEMATTNTLQLAPGSNYRFRVRATDDNGNTSSWKYGPRFAVDAHQETSSSISYAGTWKNQSVSWASGGALKFSTAKDSTAKLTFTGRNVAWIAPKAPNRGRAEVYLDGKKVATVDLYSSKVLPRRAVYSASGLDPTATHTLEVKVLGTKRAVSKGVQVDVDAFVVLR